MTPRVYNIALAIGLALVAGGVALLSVPAALIVTGGLVLGLTVLGAWLGSR